MTDDLRVRLLEPDEHRAASTLFRGTLHHPPATDEAWAQRVDSFREGRVLGAYRGDVLVGTAMTTASELAVPGGAVLPMAMVTAVGVRADHTRRGVLTALMRAQLGGVPEPFASLRASEAPIYGRFGYGVATRGRAVTVDRRRAVCRPEAPAGGAIRLLTMAEALPLLPELYRAMGADGPGWVARSDGYWQLMTTKWAELKAHAVIAVHSGPDGDDGYAIYQVERRDNRRVLLLADLHAANPRAWAALWRFLVSVDLVAEIRADLRPLDEPLELLFTDRRVVTTTDIDDETWLRVIDVPTALAARSFGGSAADGSVVIELVDDFLPANSGRYRLGDGPARRVEEPAELVLGADALAMLYLGDVMPSALAATGRLTVVKADALSVADRLCAVAGSPWAGTYF